MKSLRTMDYEQLVTLRAKIDASIRKLDESERNKLSQMIKEVCSVSTATLEPTTRRGHALKGRSLKPKYRNPADRTQTWAGRGLTPRWIRTELKKGKKLAAFLIK